MPGYPNKITRNSLGPTYVNAGKLGKVDEEADAGVFNLMCWQVSGMSGCCPRAVIIGQADNASISFIKQWFAWDPNGNLGQTTFGRTSAGVYTWALPGSGTYGDMNGNPTVFQADFAYVLVMGNSDRNVIAALNSDNISGTINCYIGGLAVDIGFAGLFRKFMLVLI